MQDEIPQSNRQPHFGICEVPTIVLRDERDDGDRTRDEVLAERTVGRPMGALRKDRDPSAGITTYTPTEEEFSNFGELIGTIIEDSEQDGHPGASFIRV